MVRHMLSELPNRPELLHTSVIYTSPQHHHSPPITHQFVSTMAAIDSTWHEMNYN